MLTKQPAESRFTCRSSPRRFLAQTSSYPRSIPTVLGRSKFPSLKYLTPHKSQSPSENLRRIPYRRKTVCRATQSPQVHPMIPMRIRVSLAEHLHAHNQGRCDDSGGTSGWLKNMKSIRSRQSHLIATSARVFLRPPREFQVCSSDECLLALFWQTSAI